MSRDETTEKEPLSQTGGQSAELLTEPTSGTVLPKLWNKNFTILVLGSFVSMMGYTCASFAMGLLVFDKTDSVLLYALTLIASMVPRVISPMIAGTFFDRHSRRRAIYTIDFIYASVFASVAILLSLDSFVYWMYLIVAVILGSADGMYMVAFDSLFPLLTTTKTSRQAYSVNSMLYPIASMITSPLTLLGYDSIGPTNIFIGATLLFLITATIETRIIVREPHLMKYELEKQEKLPPSPKELELTAKGSLDTLIGEKKERGKFFDDFRQGIRYISGEKGLMAVTMYFFVISICNALMNTFMLPYFRRDFIFIFNGEQLDGMWAYLAVFGCSTVGRILGAMVQYKVKFRPDKRYNVAVWVYIITNVIYIFVFHLPMWLMCVVLLCEGTLSVTSYNIRISSTQNYVPDDKRGRFNGAFMFFNMVGSVLGQLIAGIIGDFNLSVPIIMTVTFIVNLAFVFIIVLPAAKHIRPVYNADL